MHRVNERAAGSKTSESEAAILKHLRNRSIREQLSGRQNVWLAPLDCGGKKTDAANKTDLVME